MADVELTVIQTNMFGSLDNFPLLAIPFFILAGEIMGQAASPAGSSLGHGADRQRARLAAGDDHRVVGTIRRHVAYRGRHRRGGRPAGLSGAQAGGYNDRFTVSLIASSGRHRGGDPTVDLHDPL